MITVHVITSHLAPYPGGLERWTRDLAMALLGAGLKPIIYVCEEQEVLESECRPFEIVDIARLRAPWEEPLRESRCEPRRLRDERSRLSFLSA